MGRRHLNRVAGEALLGSKPAICLPSLGPGPWAAALAIQPEASCCRQPCPLPLMAQSARSCQPCVVSCDLPEASCRWEPWRDPQERQ